jgi:hypothetical protein
MGTKGRRLSGRDSRARDLDFSIFRFFDFLVAAVGFPSSS